MARIRTIKPEFWTDDLLGSMSRESRLLFIATWNMADDEGLLRWTSPFLKGAVFPFDDDISVRDVQKMMDELAESGVVFPYVGGRSQQSLCYIVNFLKHQKINRPSPSRLPPPPIGDDKVKKMYASRDGGICHLCQIPFDENWSDKYQWDFLASPDHITPQSKGGSDFPSNIKAAHLTCNKGRGDRSVEQYVDLLRNGKTVAQKRYPERFSGYSVISSVNNSITEREHGTGSEETDQGPRTKDQGMDRTKDQGRASAAAGALPDWVPREAWFGFVDMRKSIRAPLGPRAITLAISTLAKMRDGGEDPAAILDQSTQNSWKGLFPIKKGNGHDRAKRPTALDNFLAGGASLIRDLEGGTEDGPPESSASFEAIDAPSDDLL